MGAARMLRVVRPIGAAVYAMATGLSSKYVYRRFYALKTSQWRAVRLVTLCTGVLHHCCHHCWPRGCRLYFCRA